MYLLYLWKKYFSCDCTKLLHTARYPHHVILNLHGSGFGFLFVFYILSKLPHLFQTSWCFSTKQCLDCQYLDHCTSAQSKIKKSRAYSTSTSSCGVPSILIFAEQHLFVIATHLSDSQLVFYLNKSAKLMSKLKTNPREHAWTSKALHLSTAHPFASLGSKDFALKYFSFSWVK